MKKHIITIAGKLGSGKSSAGKRIAQELGYQHFSSGDFFREAAERRGMTVTELNTYSHTDPSVDFEVDQILRDKGSESNLVIDSRLAFHWIPQSFKVYLELDARIAAERMFHDMQLNPSRKSSENSDSLEEMIIDSEKRLYEEKKRYEMLYHIDHTDHNQFDLVINTGLPEHTLNYVVDTIIEKYHEWLKN